MASDAIDRPLPPRVPARQDPSTSVWLPGATALLILSVVKVRSSDLWLDEAFSVAATHRLTETLTETHWTMALYYAALSVWTTVSQDPTWVRLLSVMAAVSAVALFGRFVGRLYDPWTGRVAGLLAGTSPLIVQYAAEARSYAMVMLLSVVGWMSLEQSIRNTAARSAPVVFAATALLLPLMHGLAILQVLAMTGAALFFRPNRWACGWIITGTAASLVTTGLLVSSGASSEVGNWVEPPDAASIIVFLAQLLIPFAPGALLLTAVLLAGAERCVRDASLPLMGRVAPMLWGPGTALALIGLSLLRPSLLPRYALPTALGFAILMALALRPLDRWAGAAAVSLIVAGFIIFSPDAGEGPSWSEVAGKVSSESNDGDLIAFASSDARMPFEVEWLRIDERPHLDVAGPGSPLGTFDRFGSRAEPEELIDEMLGHGRVWVIDQEYLHQGSLLTEVLEDSRVESTFAVSETWTISALHSPIQIYLLTARPEAR